MKTEMKTDERTIFLAYVAKALRLKPDDETDKLTISELSEYVGTRRPGMIFDFRGARTAIRDFKWDRFATPRFVDLVPVLDRAWFAERAASRPRRFFDAEGRPAGERRCADCRGKGWTHRCAHVDGPWRSSSACLICTGAASLCRNCLGGGYSADETFNEDVPYVTNNDRQLKKYLDELREILVGGGTSWKI